MKFYFLDTSFLVDILRGRENALKLHEELKGQEVTGSVCVYELAKFSGADVSQLFKDKSVMPFTEHDAAQAGAIYRELSGVGKSIGEIDTQIAGMVRNRNLTLVTRDEHFKEVSGIDTLFYGD